MLTTAILYTVLIVFANLQLTGPWSAVGSEPGFTSRDGEFEPSPVTYFYWDWSWNSSNGYSSSADSNRAVVSYKLKYVLYKILVNRLAKLGQEKSVVRWTDSLNMTIYSCWLRRKTSNKKPKWSFNCVQNLTKFYRIMALFIKEDFKNHCKLCLQPICRLEHV